MNYYRPSEEVRERQEREHQEELAEWRRHYLSVPRKWRAVIEVETRDDSDELSYRVLETALDFGELTVVEATIVDPGKHS
jgi:hypothetical protein